MWCLGIDPGLKATGLVALEWRGGKITDTRTGFVETSPNDGDFFQRANIILPKVNRWVDETIAGLDAHCAIEHPHNSKNRKAHADQAGLFRMLGMLVWKKRLTVWLCAPTQVKKFVTGRGVGVPKDAIRLEVYKRWKFEHKLNDVVDAYAIAQLASCIALLGTGPFTQVQKQVADRVVTPQQRRKRRTD